MGDVFAGFGLLADTATAVHRFLDVFFTVYILLLIAYVLLSWVRLPYSPTFERIQRFLYDVCDPYLRIFRRFVPPLGPVDLSPIVGIFVLYGIRALVVALVDRLL